MAEKKYLDMDGAKFLYNDLRSRMTALKGDKGDIGPAGSDGKSATVTVGTVTEGTTASVTNSGDNLNAKLDFVLPKAKDGIDGQAGADGKSATITVGNVTTGDTPSVTNTGTETDAVFDFVFPAGGGSGASGDFKHESTGYEVLPSGLTLQWGVFNYTGNGKAQTISFPLSFPTACTFVTTITGSQLASQGGSVLGICSKTNVNARVAGYPPHGASGSTLWFAVGY